MVGFKYFFVHPYLGIVSGDFWQNFAHGNDNSSDDLTSTYPSTGDLKGGIPQPFPGSPNKTITTKPSFGKRNVWFFPTIEQAHLSQERQEMYRMIRNHLVAFEIWHHRVIFLSIKHPSNKSKIPRCLDHRWPAMWPVGKRMGEAVVHQKTPWVTGCRLRRLCRVH